ncbi:MAG: family 1 glycosylhydrolase [Candidatus Moduliflexus flocculans]|nr:family 1 glycosylhydrolase [Candidatus Moduliflexus flocculans]
MHRAVRAGVPLAGCFVWSLMDNFEWSHVATASVSALSAWTIKPRSAI